MASRTGGEGRRLRSKHVLPIVVSGRLRASSGHLHRASTPSLCPGSKTRRNSRRQGWQSCRVEENTQRTSSSRVRPSSASWFSTFLRLFPVRRSTSIRVSPLSQRGEAGGVKAGTRSDSARLVSPVNSEYTRGLVVSRFWLMKPPQTVSPEAKAATAEFPAAPTPLHDLAVNYSRRPWI